MGAGLGGGGGVSGMTMSFSSRILRMKAGVAFRDCGGCAFGGGVWSSSEVSSGINPRGLKIPSVQPVIEERPRKQEIRAMV